jgi:hypothetical protein
METRKCPRCNDTKPVTEFFDTGPSGRISPYCRPCTRAYAREHRKPRTTEQLAVLRARDRERRAIARGGESYKALQVRLFAQGQWRCPRCSTIKPLAEFYLSPATGKPRTYCIPCWKAYGVEWRRDNPAHRAQARANRHRPEVAHRLRSLYLLRRFGITVERYQALWDLHSGACHICGDPFPSTGRDTLGRTLNEVHAC